MAARPRDTCEEECVGGIIYGNCQQFLVWYREFNRLEVCFESFLSLGRSSVTSE
jgi:hypothetical protein